MKINTTILCGFGLLVTAALIWRFVPNSEAVREVIGKPIHGSDTPSDAAIGHMTTWESSGVSKLPVMANLSAGALQDMKNAAEKMDAVLANVPDDQSGKRSPWFEQLKTWHQLLREAAESGAREDLFALVPIAASFFTRDREAEPLVESLDNLRHWMEHLGPHIIREIANVVDENGGTLDALTGTLAVQVFSVRGFDNEPDWEDERKPIDSAGILISRPELLQSLETLPVEQLSFFLRAQTADAFFRRYVQSGDGMPVLRQRYSENREELHRNFDSLAGKVAAYQASTQAK